MNTNPTNSEVSPMKMASTSFLQRVFSNQQGQAAIFVALGLVAMLGVGGLTVDVGHAYAVRRQLQSSVNAAALAAAGGVYNASSADDAATLAAQYGSGAKGNANYDPSLGTVTTTVNTTCLNMLMKGTTCATSGNVANAVKVTESAHVPTYFMSIFGVKTLTVGATAMASMQGVAQAWNVAIVVDSTGSMATVDSNCGGLTEFQCALSGVQSLLQATNPACPPGSANCPTGANFRVSLFTFPNVLTSMGSTAVPSLSDDINCGGRPATYTSYTRQPIAAPYTLPLPGASLPGAPDATYMTYTETSAGQNPGKTWTATYQITPFLSDYYDASNTSAGGLNPNSQLVKAVGYGTTPGCLTYTFGIDGSSGQGSNFGNTYFASSIYAAQSALTAAAAANPGSKNAIIFLSDGQANASYYAKNKSAYGTANTTNQYMAATEFPEAPAVVSTASPFSSSKPLGSEVGPTTTAYPVPAYLTPATTSSAVGYSVLGVNGKGIYPDWYDQCQQAIMASKYAQSQGTTVYAVAYGSESSGCSNGWSVGATDTTLVATGTFNQPFSSVSKILPCTTMEDIASSWSYFYSDNQQTGNVNLGCTDENHTTVSLRDIFYSIAGSFTNPRLLPNDAT
jgi:Flp pilus assembly protein TadG